MEVATTFTERQNNKIQKNTHVYTTYSCPTTLEIKPSKTTYKFQILILKITSPILKEDDIRFFCLFLPD